MLDSGVRHVAVGVHQGKTGGRIIGGDGLVGRAQCIATSHHVRILFLVITHRDDRVPTRYPTGKSIDGAIA